MAKVTCQQINGKTGHTFRNAFVKGNGATDGFIAFQQASGTLADLTSDVGALAFEGTTLKRWNGTSWGTISGSGASTFEDLYTSDQVFALSNVAGWTITQSAAGPVLTLTKSNSGAGAMIVTNNAGTGIDLSVIKTESSSTGVVFNTFHNSSTAADSDVIFEHLVRGTDDAGTPASVSYGRVRFIADDVSAGTEDATYQLALMVGGTSRTCLAVTSSTVTVGNGNANATLTSSGNFDLVLQTGNGTTGSITIADGADGNIQIAPDGTGILDLNSGFDIDAGSTETCTITVVGTTGDGLAIDSSTITSGAVVMINHSSAATLNGGQLLDLQIGGTSYYTFGETTFNIVGTAGSNAQTITAGDVVYSDGSLTITDADNAATFSVTNDTATTASPFVFAGSGAFTGTTTSSFMTLTASGLTTGTALYIATAAATTLSKAIDITTSTTTGKGITITMTGVQTGVGSALEIVADSATTPGASAGEGIVKISADGMTTGSALDVTSTSIVLTSGRIADFSHISGNITGTLNKTADFFNVSSFRTVTTGTVADDYDMVNLIRTSVINGGGTFSATGSVLYIENAVTNTSGTVSDTVNGIELVMDSLGTGDAIKITDNRTTGSKVINMTSAVTTGTGMLMTLADLTTSGVGLSITNSTSTGLTSGSLIRVTTATTGAVATNGVVSIRATGAYTSTSNVGLVDILASGVTGAGTVCRIKASAASQTATEVLRVEASGYTTGYSGVVMNVVGVATTGAAATTHSVLTVTGANTTGGNMIQLTNNALTTGLGILFAHTTSVIADGGSMLRLSSSSVDTGGATNGTILDIGNTGATAATVVKITDTALTSGVAFGIAATGVYTGTGLVNISAANTTGTAVLLTVSSLTTGNGLSVTSASADTGAFNVARFAVTNTAATAASPIRTSNVAVNNSKFTKVLSHTDGTKTVTIWMSQDATTPNGTLSGTAGDICLNGPSNRTFYCTGTTNWTASNA